MVIRLAPDIHRIKVIDDEVARILSAKTGAERQMIADDMYPFARQALLARVRATHPDWTETQVTSEVVRRMTDDSLRVAVSLKTWPS